MEQLYALKDHLGSTDLIVDALGSVVSSFRFDAFGQRRNTRSGAALSSSQLLNFENSVSNRGYTGHEMVDEVGLIHMNGRIYDATLGRFLQADPFVQAPGDTQSYNRYAYVRNNPMNATDPSGYNWISDRWHAVKDEVKTAVVVVAIAYLSIVTYGAASNWAIAAYGSSCTVICSMSTAKIIGGVVGGAAAGFTSGASYAAYGGANSADIIRGGYVAPLQGLYSAELAVILMVLV